MRLAGAQFVSGATPAEASGPDVAALQLQTNTIWPGFPDKALMGTLGESATAAAIALSTDNGYWIVPAGVPDVSAPALPTFHATASFSSSLPAGSYTLEVRAVDLASHFGAPFRQVLSALAAAPTRAVSGKLVVTLEWDTESDLDVHVVDPSGNEVFHGAPNSVGPFSPEIPGQTNGRLVADSNGACRIDGLREEDVSWSDTPPSGHYLVRVDTASLCGAPNAHWTVRVLLEDVLVGQTSGISLDSDTRGAHDRGAGLLALGFDVP